MSDSPEEKDNTRTRLSPHDWAEIEELWESGAVTLQQLSERFLVSVSHLSRGLTRRGAAKGAKSKPLVDAAKERIHETLVDATSEKMKRVAETKNDHYKYAQTLSKLVFQLIAQKVQSRESISGAREDIKTIKDALTALSIGRDERFRVLGLDKDVDTGDEVPALIVTEMTQDQIEAVKNRHDAELGTDLSEEELDAYTKDDASAAGDAD
jgi:hypothetical protein